MTKEELITVLLTDSGDTESDHGHADDALLEYIGDPEITDAFNAVEKWYA